MHQACTHVQDRQSITTTANPKAHSHAASNFLFSKYFNL